MLQYTSLYIINFRKDESVEFPVIKSAHSLVAKYVTEDKWKELSGHETKTCGFTLGKAIACAVEFDNQHCGIYAGDWDSYRWVPLLFSQMVIYSENFDLLKILTCIHFTLSLGTFLSSLTRSSWSTMASQQRPSTPLTWTPASLSATLILPYPYTPQGRVATPNNDTAFVKFSKN